MSLLTDLFSHADAGVFAVDGKQRIVFWNDACDDLLGSSAREAVGYACFDVVRACDVSGQCVCKPGCRMARLAMGGSAIRPAPLWFDTGRGESIKLSMHTALLPSQEDDRWIVVHLLRRKETATNAQPLSGRHPSLLSGARSSDETLPATSATLTVRENGVLRLLAEGHTTSLIARQLCISIATVRNHIQHLSEKLGVHSQLEAVAHAHRHKLI